MADFEINSQRLLTRINELGEYGKIPGTERGVNAMEFSDENIKARLKLIQYMEEAGVEVRIDEIGNIIGVLPASNGNSEKDIVLMGSHIDTVKTGGRFDGRLGVLGGLEILQSMAEQKSRRDFPVAVIAYTGEEGARFQPAMIGSRVERGLMSAQEALAIKSHDADDNGYTMQQGMDKFKEALKAASTSQGFEGIKLKKKYEEFSKPGLKLRSYTELHIEQGTELEEAKVSVAAVNAGGGISQRFIDIEVPSGQDATALALKINRDVREYINNHSAADYKNERGTVGIIEPVFEDAELKNCVVYKFQIKGESAHAGGGPMRKRKDAGFAAAKIEKLFSGITEGKSFVSRLDINTPGINTVPSDVVLEIAVPAEEGNIIAKENLEKLLNKLRQQPKGKKSEAAPVPDNEGVEVTYNRTIEAVSKPANKVRMSVDFRHIEDQKLSEMDDWLNRQLKSIKNKNPDAKIFWQQKQRIAPAPFHNQLMKEILSECEVLTGQKMQIPLFPGHDAANHVYAEDGVRVPANMIAIRCKDGISHNPAEYSSDEDIMAGMTVLKNLVGRLIDKKFELEPVGERPKVYPVGQRYEVKKAGQMLMEMKSLAAALG